MRTTMSEPAGRDAPLRKHSGIFRDEQLRSTIVACHEANRRELRLWISYRSRCACIDDYSALGEQAGNRWMKEMIYLACRSCMIRSWTRHHLDMQQHAWLSRTACQTAVVVATIVCCFVYRRRRSSARRGNGAELPQSHVLKF
jgi:hypothetical protein